MRLGAADEFRVHAVEPYKLGLWRYGLRKEFIRNIGWYDNHGPRAAMQTVPDGFFTETVFFTTEAEARAAEQQQMPPEVRALLDEEASLVSDMQFLDLHVPWFAAAERKR